MKEVKELEIDKEVLKRIEMICRFACVKPIIKQGSIINIKGTLNGVNLVNTLVH